MTEQNTFARTLHDLGLAAWFGGALMGAVGLNGASQEVSDPRERARVADSGWGRWTPVNALAIGAHLLGGLQVMRGNAGRLATQKGVASTTGIKAGLTLAALGATAYSRMLGQRIMDAEARAAQQGAGLAVGDATDPVDQTPADVENAQRQLTVLQWAIPALTGALLVLNAKMGEQQRPGSVLHGVRDRLGVGN